MAPQPHSEACRQRMDACMEQASRQLFSQTVVGMHSGTDISGGVQGASSPGSARPMDGIVDGAQYSGSLRDVLLDREARAM